jgi:membrane protein DedA with SNARE-associated domain
VAEFGYVLGLLEFWIHQYGGVAILLILTFESFGLPLPGESLLIVAAILAARGDLSFLSLFVCAWAGAVLGDNIGYIIGRMFGHRFLWRYGKKIGLNAERLHRVEAVFARYGPLTVCFARFINMIRQLTGIVAGTLQMDWRRFLLFNALGGALWVLAWTMAGFYLGSHGADIAVLVHKLGVFGAIAFLTALIVVVAYLYGHRAFARLYRMATTVKGS